MCKGSRNTDGTESASERWAAELRELDSFEAAVAASTNPDEIRNLLRELNADRNHFARVLHTTMVWDADLTLLIFMNLREKGTADVLARHIAMNQTVADATIRTVLARTASARPYSPELDSPDDFTDFGELFRAFTKAGWITESHEVLPKLLAACDDQGGIYSTNPAADFAVAVISSLRQPKPEWLEACAPWDPTQGTVSHPYATESVYANSVGPGIWMSRDKIDYLCNLEDLGDLPKARAALAPYLAHASHDALCRYARVADASNLRIALHVIAGDIEATNTLSRCADPNQLRIASLA
jgi:hypothetical protein